MNQYVYETWADAQYDQMKDDIAEKQYEDDEDIDEELEIERDRQDVEISEDEDE